MLYIIDIGTGATFYTINIKIFSYHGCNRIKAITLSPYELLDGLNKGEKIR